jgi:hypothetical protein
MNIAVLGTGTVGVMSVLHFLRYMPDAKVDCIFNPKKDILGIGESSNTQLPQLLWESVDYNTFGDSKELDLGEKTILLVPYYPMGMQCILIILIYQTQCLKEQKINTEKDLKSFTKT